MMTGERTMMNALGSLFGRSALFGAAALGAGLACRAGEFTVVTNGTREAGYDVVVTNASGATQTMTDVYRAEDGFNSLTFAGGSWIYYYPTAASTYAGGTFMLGGENVQTYVNRGDALGTGPVYMESGRSLMVKGCDVVFTNKVVFEGLYSYVCGFKDDNTGVDGSVTLKSIATSSAAGIHRVRLGRNVVGKSKVTLALTESDSEAVPQIRLSGVLDLTLDGGVVKASAAAVDLFFCRVDSDASPTINVTTNGVGFDAAAGATVRLGEKLNFACDYPFDEALTPENAGFETGSAAPWTLEKHAGEGTWYSPEIKTTPCAWDNNGAWASPDGTHFLMMRTGSSAYQTVSVPTAGKWRVAFLRGCRPNYSAGMTLTVKVDGDVVETFPAVASSEEEGFVELTTPVIDLAAGDHVVRFELEALATQSKNTFSMNVDAVRLERQSETDVHGTLTKTGAGTLRFAEGQVFDRVSLAASAGRLDLAGTIFSNATLSVANGGTAVLTGTTLEDTNTTIAVAAGGTLELGSWDGDLIVNGSFEADDAGANGFTTLSPTGWTRIGPGVDLGVQRNGGTVSKTGPTTAYGEQTVFIRPSYAIRQTVNVTEANTYRLSFMLGVRDYANSYASTVDVLVDDVSVVSVPAQSAYYDYTRYSQTCSLAAGTHVLTITNTSSMAYNGGSMVFVDDVRLEGYRAPLSPIAAQVNLATGARLVLDNVGRVEIPNCTVDGTPVNGHAYRLRQAGVDVSGEGDLFVGENSGTFIILR